MIALYLFLFINLSIAQEVCVEAPLKEVGALVQNVTQLQDNQISSELCLGMMACQAYEEELDIDKNIETAKKIIKALDEEIANLKKNKQSTSETTLLKNLYQTYIKNPKAYFFYKLESEKALVKISDQVLDCDEAKSELEMFNNLIKERNAGHCGMTTDEKILLSYYTGGGYVCLNPFLRTEAKNNPKWEKIKYLVDHLNSALDKLPNYEGLLNRASDIPKHLLPQYKVGNVLTFDAFTSTTTEPDVGNIQILSRTGRPVMGLSRLPEEHEVLFKSGTKFKLISIEERDNASGEKYIVYTFSELPTVESDTEILKRFKERTNKSEKPYAWSCPKDANAVIPKSVVGQ